MRRKAFTRWAVGWLLLWLALAGLLRADSSSPNPGSQASGNPTSSNTNAPTEARSASSSSSGLALQTPSGATGTTGSTAEPNQLFLEFKYTVNGTDLQGNTARSFLHEGINHIFDFSFFTNQEVWGNRRFEALSILRYTDDPRVDPERNTAQRAYARLSGPTFEANLGDYLVNYSRFSFNQNIKGLNVWKRLPVGHGLKLTATAGVFSDRWGGVFRSFREIISNPVQPPTPQFPTKPFTRLVLGARAQQYLLDDTKFIAVNFSQGSDVIRSLPREARLTPINNKVVSLDGEALFRKAYNLRIAGELAYGLTNFDTRRLDGLHDGWARRFEASQRISKLNWRFDYAHFGPRFFSANARQVQDLIDVGVRGSYEFNQYFMVSGAFRRTIDNLNDARPFTTQVRTPEVRATFRNLPFYRRMILETGYRERNVDASRRCTNPPSCTQPERTTRIPFVDVSMPFGSSFFNFSYEHRHNRDRVTRTNSTFTDRFLIGYRGSHFFASWSFAPFIRFEVEREQKEIQTAPTATTFKEGVDINRSIQGGFTLDAPKYWVFEAFYREFNSVNLVLFTSTNRARFPAGFDFGNGGFERPSFKVSIQYKIQNDENKSILLSYERNINTFALADPTRPDDRSFRETVIQATLLYRFRR